MSRFAKRLGRVSTLDAGEEMHLSRADVVGRLDETEGVGAALVTDHVDTEDCVIV